MTLHLSTQPVDGKPRGILIAGNWKMNHSRAETESFFDDIKTQASHRLTAQDVAHIQAGNLRACVIPPMLSLEHAKNLSRQCPFRITIAAQNVHWDKKGAFTGEIAGPMLQELDIQWALVGHSERRQFFGETNETARKRTESLLAQGFQVILCIGETRAEREQERTTEILTSQLLGVFPEASAGAASFLDGRLILAYEPVWAIGTGLTASPKQVEEAHQTIRALLTERFGAAAAGKTPLLYGGSVTPENIDALLTCSDVDGALVGGASLKPESFLALLAGGSRALVR